MKIQPYIEKLNGSKEYADFVEKYPKAFLAAGFFVLDLESKNNVHQIDYFIPEENKVAAFTLDGNSEGDEKENGVKMQLMELMKRDKIPEVLDINTNIDLDALEGILEDEMKNRSITEKINKIIAVLQTIEGKKIWNLNCVLSGMELLRAHIDDDSKTVLKMEKVSMMDIMKHIPKEALRKGHLPAETVNKGEVKEQIDKLNKMEKKIEEEKEKLEDSLKGKKE